MSDQQLDYHVGLLRGFVLAHNAPTAILHALDVLLTDYRSKAGAVIGSRLAVATFTRDLGVEKTIEKLSGDPPHIPPPTDFNAKEEKPEPAKIWTKWLPDEIDIIKKSVENGIAVSEIVKLLPGRKYATVYAKVTSLGLSAPKKEASGGR